MAYHISARALFEGVLPRLFAQTAALKELSGRVEFHLMGPEGGLFCVDFDARKVEPGAASGASPTGIVRCSSIDLMALLEGRMSVSDGLLTGRLQLSGDPVALQRLFHAMKSLEALS